MANSPVSPERTVLDARGPGLAPGRGPRPQRSLLSVPRSTWAHWGSVWPVGSGGAALPSHPTWGPTRGASQLVPLLRLWPWAHPHGDLISPRHAPL